MRGELLLAQGVGVLPPTLHALSAESPSAPCEGNGETDEAMCFDVRVFNRPTLSELLTAELMAGVLQYCSKPVLALHAATAGACGAS